MSAAARRLRLQGILADRGLDGMIVTTLVNVRYLTGFTGSNGALVVPSEGATTFLTDGRYRDQAAAELSDVKHTIGRDLLAGAAEGLAGRWATENHQLSVDAHARLQSLAPDVSWISSGPLVEALREVKDEVEIAALRQACDISTRALMALLETPLAGRTERQVARDLDNRMLDLGAEAIAFDTILAAGDNTAIPHHSPTDRVLERGHLVKIDFGARVDGYHADCTRTVVIGPADAWQREVHAAVRASQQAGVDALVAGARIADADAAARGSLADSGWLHAFTTGLGHGVGLEIHEDPFVASTHPGKLTSRTVLTMEPGIYVPGRGGVRIEDTVLVGDGTPEVLTTMTKQLLEIA